MEQRLGVVGAAVWLAAFAVVPPPTAARPLAGDAADTEPAVGNGHWSEETPPALDPHQLLEDAETALARGQALAANESFERAAAMRHTADAEMGVVRAAMQAGDYGRALALAAHVAGEHLDAPAAAALYAWLLRAGGQPAVADEVLAAARARAPLDPVLWAARTAFQAPLPLAGGALLALPHRTAPQSWSAERQPTIPADAAVVATGVLLGHGRFAIVPALPALVSARGLWLRNGMGQTVAAEVEGDDVALAVAGLARLRLAGPLPLGDADAAADRVPFAGSPAFVVEYAATERATPAWPWLRQGFLGSLGRSGERRLGIAAGAGLRGGPVLDARGRLVGIAIPGSRDGAAWLPASAWSEPGRGDATRAAATASAAPMSLERAYERGLRIALQVVAAPPGP